MFKKIINTCLLVCAIFGFSFQDGKTGFKAAQVKSARVKAAYNKKWAELQELLRSKQLDVKGFELYLRVFKQEDKLEVWAKDKGHSAYQLLKTFAVCAKSGDPGPKRKEGDGQVPEGFYTISAFNPYSSYHLSLKVSYPNKSDLLKATGRPGGDIMIHGNCVTIGCIPIQNEPIEELFVLCVEAKNRGLTIPVDIYPYKFGGGLTSVMSKDRDEETLLLWESMKKAHTYFELNHILPKIAVDKKGNYIL
jgi:murein L,D-transpeptidase YafK